MNIMLFIMLLVIVGALWSVSRSIDKLTSLTEDYIKYRAQVHMLHEERYANELRSRG